MKKNPVKGQSWKYRESLYYLLMVWGYRLLLLVVMGVAVGCFDVLNAPFTATEMAVTLVGYMAVNIAL